MEDNSSGSTTPKRVGRPPHADKAMDTSERRRRYKDKLNKQGLKSLEAWLSPERIEKLDKMAKVRGVSRKELLTYMLNRVIDNASIYKPNKSEDNK